MYNGVIISLNILITTAHFIEAHIYIFLNFDVTSASQISRSCIRPKAVNLDLTFHKNQKVAVFTIIKAVLGTAYVAKEVYLVYRTDMVMYFKLCLTSPDGQSYS
jgi:hypothetical protein